MKMIVYFIFCVSCISCAHCPVNPNGGGGGGGCGSIGVASLNKDTGKDVLFNKFISITEMENPDSLQVFRVYNSSEKDSITVSLQVTYLSGMFSEIKKSRIVLKNIYPRSYRDLTFDKRLHNSNVIARDLEVISTKNTN